MFEEAGEDDKYYLNEYIVHIDWREREVLVVKLWELLEKSQLLKGFIKLVSVNLDKDIMMIQNILTTQK